MIALPNALPDDPVLLDQALNSGKMFLRGRKSPVHPALLQIHHDQLQLPEIDLVPPFFLLNLLVPPGS